MFLMCCSPVNIFYKQPLEIEYLSPFKRKPCVFREKLKLLVGNTKTT